MASGRSRDDDHGDATDGTAPAARWWDRPVGWPVVSALILVVVAAPVAILWPDLVYYVVSGDDFAYISEARGWPTTRAHLLEPHNTHVVPLFRLWTYGLVATAGRLEALPATLAVASYLGLVAAMAAVGWLVARETGRTVLALSAMAVLGISTVTRPAVSWYSAGQALWAGTAIVVTVALARGWAIRGGAGRLVALAISAMVAPAFWSGGLVAGPAAIAYLARKSPARARGAAALLAGVAAGFALLIVALSRRQIRETGIVWEHHADLWPRPIQATLHTAQAMVEACILGNLGLDAVTAPWQAVGVLAILAALHARTRGGWGRVDPLEAAGATIAVGGCLTVYFFRGNLPYSSLRALGWYHLIPQVGAILFAAGWWAATTAVGPGRMTRRQALGVLGLVLLLGMLQAPRARQQLIAEAPAFAPDEEVHFPVPELRVTRAYYLKVEFHDRQLRALKRLDRVDRILARLHASPDSLRDLFGRVLVPGIPERQLSTDAFTMLTPRPRDERAARALPAQRAQLAELLRVEPEPERYWIRRSSRASQAAPDASNKPAEGPGPR